MCACEIGCVNVCERVSCVCMNVSAFVRVFECVSRVCACVLICVLMFECENVFECVCA